MKYDVIIIGGGPAGVVGAMTARKYYKNKSILLIKDVDRGVIPCGIPYIINTLKSCGENELSYDPLKKLKIDVKTGEVTKIKRKEKKVIIREEISYEKLVLTTGSKPLVPPIPGIDKKGIYPVLKDMDYLKKIRNELRKSKNIILVGGGYIGVEFADEVANMKNKNITIVEMLPKILGPVDNEFSQKVYDKLIERKVKILTNTKVEEFLGAKKVEAIKTNKGKIKADVVVLGTGAGANYKLAEEAGIKIENRSIWVDKFQRTSDKNIFAAGDCAYKKDFITSKQSRALLASSACTEARIAGKNLFNQKTENKGTIGVYSTKVDDICIGSAGVTENQAKKEGINIVVGLAEAPDKHPGKMPGTKMMKLKLVFSKDGAELIGGEIFGGDSVGEMINIIGEAIQRRINAKDLEILEVGTHPKLTPPPTKYPIIMAAQDALSKL